MIRLSSFFFVILVLLIQGTAYAEEFRQGHLGTVQQHRACRPDVLRHCRALMDQSDHAIADCLRAHARALSPVCREALEQANRR